VAAVSVATNDSELAKNTIHLKKYSTFLLSQTPKGNKKQAISELSCASFSKGGFVQSFSYENEFYLQVNENSFSYERLCSRTRFEKRGTKQLGNGLLFKLTL